MLLLGLTLLLLLLLGPINAAATARYLLLLGPIDAAAAAAARYLLLLGPSCEVGAKSLARELAAGNTIGLVPDGIAGIFRCTTDDETIYVCTLLSLPIFVHYLRHAAHTHTILRTTIYQSVHVSACYMIYTAHTHTTILCEVEIPYMYKLWFFANQTAKLMITVLWPTVEESQRFGKAGAQNRQKCCLYRCTLVSVYPCTAVPITWFTRSPQVVLALYV